MQLPDHLLDEQLVLGALLRGALSPRDVDGWAPSEGKGRLERALGGLHRDIFFATLGSIALWRRVDLGRVVRFVGPAAGVLVDGRPRGYAFDLLRRAPARGPARCALGRLLYAAGLQVDAAVSASDEALREVDRIERAAAKRRAREMPRLLQAIEEASR